MSDKILITGGLGNLGSWLTRSFCEANYKVTVLSKTNRNILPQCDFEFISCDISDAQLCKEVLSTHAFNYVIHAASTNDFFIDNYSDEARRINTDGTFNLLNALQTDTLKQFFYLSTFQVYGKFEGLINEETIPDPQNDYGSSHLKAEDHMMKFQEDHAIPCAAIRLTNSYGCPVDFNSSKWYLVLNDLARMAVERKEIVLKSNGLAPRDFIWMGDVCSVFKELIANDDPINGVFNLSGESTYTIMDVAEKVKQAYQKKYSELVNIVVNPDDTTVYVDDLNVSSQKLKKVVNFQAQDKFMEEALQIFDLVEQQSDKIS